MEYHAHFIFTQVEHDTLKKKARQCGMSKSAFIRSLIMGRKVKARPPEALQQLYVEINKIGVNINQIARNCNAGADPETSAKQVLFLLKKVYSLMERVAGG